MKKLTTEKSGKRGKSLVAHCSPSTANLRPTLTVEERFDKMCLRAIRTNPDFFVNVEIIRNFMVKELKANDDKWRSKVLELKAILEKNKDEPVTGNVVLLELNNIFIDLKENK